MRLILIAIFFANTLNLVADEPSGSNASDRSMAELVSDIEKLRKQGQAAIERTEAIFNAEAEKLRTAALESLELKISEALETKKPEVAASLQKIVTEIKALDIGDISGAPLVLRFKQEELPRQSLAAGTIITFSESAEDLGISGNWVLIRDQINGQKTTIAVPRAEAKGLDRRTNTQGIFSSLQNLDKVDPNKFVMGIPMKLAGSKVTIQGTKNIILADRREVMLTASVAPLAGNVIEFVEDLTKVGGRGRLASGVAKIYQIIDERRLLCRLPSTPGVTVMVYCDTRNIVQGSDHVFGNQFFEVMPQTRYRSTNGGIQTVPTLRAID